MKGYVLAGKGKMEWRDGLVPPEPGEYGATIKTVAVAACITDVHMMETMAFPNLKDRAVGHEAVGIVDKVGPKVKDFKPGDRVMVPAIRADYRSLEAQMGDAKINDTSYFYSDDPNEHGVFAEVTGVKDADTTLSHIPDSVTWEQAVTVSDMGMTAFAGVEAMNVDFGDTVAVIGIGALGLTGVAATAIRGAARIIGIGSRPKTVEVARKMGATDFIDYHDGDIVKAVLDLNGGPVDRVLIAGGNASNIGKALEMVRYGGTVVSVGGFMADTETSIPMATIGYGGTDKTLRTVKAEAGRVRGERIMSLIEQKRYRPELIVTPVLHGMDQIEEAVRLIREHDKDTIKPVVFFD